MMSTLQFLCLMGVHARETIKAILRHMVEIYKVYRIEILCAIHGDTCHNSCV